MEQASDLRERISALFRDKRKILFIAVVLSGIIATGLLYDSPSDTLEFNRPDVMFMNMMIVHHDQAIEMAELAPNRTENQDILELADNISRAQRAENEQMSEWLNELGYRRPGRDHRMAGMATQEEMSRLENSSGSEFDTLFAKLMIEHHQGGIQMARTFSERGRNQELGEMQQEMIEVQTQEIQQMESFLEQAN